MITVTITGGRGTCAGVKCPELFEFLVLHGIRRCSQSAIVASSRDNARMHTVQIRDTAPVALHAIEFVGGLAPFGRVASPRLIVDCIECRARCAVKQRVKLVAGIDQTAAVAVDLGRIPDDLARAVDRAV